MYSRGRLDEPGTENVTMPWIVFADVVGYSSRLIADDEPSTLNVGRVPIAHYVGGNMSETIRCARLCRGENTRPRQPFPQPETGAAYTEGLCAAGLPD